jgi:hypothetical protein
MAEFAAKGESVPESIVLAPGDAVEVAAGGDSVARTA